MTNKCKPRRPAITGLRPIKRSEDTPHQILVDVGTKRFVDLLCALWAAKPWCTLLHFDDGLDEFL